MTAPSPPFAFPPFHSFPPFYTPQPSLTTEHSRLSKWSALLLSYSRHHRIHKLVLVDALDTDLFHNKTIKRRLALADARDVLEFMRKEGRAEWVGGRREREEGREAAWVYWRTPEEWAALVYEWVCFVPSTRLFGGLRARG
jgi:ESCRT-II complex subunit VPS25